MSPTWVIIAVALASPLLTLLGLILNHRYQWIGKKAEILGVSDGKRIEQETTVITEIFDRLDKAESSLEQQTEHTRRCEEELKIERRERLKSEFDMRTEMQTYELISDILIARNPGTETEVVEIRERMKARKAKLRDEIFLGEFPDKK